MSKVIPRCPKCGKRMADWIEGDAGFTCANSHCRTKFEIVEGRILVVVAVVHHEALDSALKVCFISK